jgi:hypothetical protein
MAAEKATHQMNRRKISVSMRTTLVVLGLIFAGIGAVIVAENVGQPVHAVAAAPQSVASDSISTVDAPGKQLSTDAYLPSNVNDQISSPSSGPRECRPEQSIVSDCTYQ